LTGPFDIAVIGAGSAGCVLASRLVAAGARVALVEAGPDYGKFSERWPRDIRDPRRRTARHDWGFQAETSRGQLSDEARARVVGGCSAHNECAAVWPPREDLDAWDVPGWSSKDLWPLIDGIERASGGSIIRGRSGPLVTRPWSDRQLTVWQSTFAEAAIAEGYGRLDDASAPLPVTGVAPFHANLRAGVRWNAAFAFLDTVRGDPRLTIFDRTEALRLALRADRAETLVCRRGRRQVEIRADRYVVCCGTYGSPLLLLRSGFSSRGLGRALQDHPGVALTFRAVRGAPRELRSATVFRSQVVLRASSGTTTNAWDLHVLPYQAEGEILIFVFFMAPRSRGSVGLRGDNPRIRFRFFEDDGAADLDALEAGIEIARQVAGRCALAVATDPAPLLRRRALRQWIRANVTGYAHATGTCRMGTDPAAVVDDRCRVRGLRNVRAADAAIVPRIPRANTNLLCMLIGARAAQLVN
jgi:choline dehydrogenase-like flavoprotein